MFKPVLMFTYDRFGPDFWRAEEKLRKESYLFNPDQQLGTTDPVYIPLFTLAYNGGHAGLFSQN